MSWSNQLNTTKAADASIFADQPKRFDELKEHLSNYVLRITAAAAAAASEESMDKDFILETRCALRFATKCLSAPETRTVVQEELIVAQQLQVPLCHVLSRASGDARIRVLAARLLSNLVTSNAVTADFVMNRVELSPSAEEVSAQLRTTVSEDSVVVRVGNHSVNWVDMILGCARSGNRQALAATVAALHNCVVVTSVVVDAETIAANQILISTLLRQVLPAAADDSGKDRADEATEWISLLLETLCSRGSFPQLYKTVGDVVVTPEHLVLLHCIAAAVDEWLHKASSGADHPLGKEDASLVASHVFLAQEANRISTTMQTMGFTEDMVLPKSAVITMYEIMATSLGDDHNQALALVRLELGTCLLPVVVQRHLTRIVDTLLDSASTHAACTKARDMKLKEDDQRWIITMVQLVGNLCFRCKRNQDALREIEVSGGGAERTGLHVLLSCTSLAPGCFTLREWAIVALRNVLEGNAENQAIVEKLEAQQPLQTAELERMGLRVDLDGQGQVKVVPKGP